VEDAEELLVRWGYLEGLGDIFFHQKFLIGLAGKSKHF
jgi:hypothetical protein